MMSGHGKSDNSIVPKKSLNKIRQGITERMEGRELAKGNLLEQNVLRTQSRVGAHSALERIREVNCFVYFVVIT